MATKTENGVEYPKSAYLYTPDPESPSTWKLRYKNFFDGKLKLDPEQLGKAVAAFSPGGFRGQQVELPEKDRKAVLKKIRSIYKNQLKVKEADMPETLRSAQEDMSLEDIKQAIDKVRDAIWLTVRPQPTYGQTVCDPCICRRQGMGGSRHRGGLQPHGSTLLAVRNASVLSSRWIGALQ